MQPVFGQDGRILYAFTSTLDGRGVLDSPPGLVASQQFPIERNNLLDPEVSPDGRWLVTTHGGLPGLEGRIRGQYRLYDVTTGKSVREPITALVNQSDYLPCAFSLDGRLLATAVGNNPLVQTKTFQIWDTATGRERGPRLEMKAPVVALAFSPDGRMVAGATWDGEVRLWDTTALQPVGPAIAHGRAVEVLRFSPDGRKLLVAGVGPVKAQARLWDVTTGQPLGPPLDTITGVQDAAFSPDGNTVLTGSLQLTLWDATTCQPIWRAPVLEYVKRLAFSPDGRRVLVTFIRESAARVFDAKTGEPVGPHMRHRKEGMYASYSPDGRLIVTASSDWVARLWDAATGLPVGPPWVNLGYTPVGFFTPDGRGLLLHQDGVIARWEIPEPIEGTPERVRLAAEAATRFSLDRYGRAQPLFPTNMPDPESPRGLKMGPDPYEPVRKRLEELGGPPGAFRR